MRASPRLLALDPGTNCGYSWIDISQPVTPGLKALPHQSGVINLDKNRFGDHAMRYIELRRVIIEIDPDFVVFEEIRFRHKSTDAARMYYGIVATVETWCKDNGVSYTGIGTGDVKKRATGKGNSGKPPIIEAANDFFEIDPPLSTSKSSSNKDDNIADAMWMCQLGIELYGDAITVKTPPTQVEEESNDGDEDE